MFLTIFAGIPCHLQIIIETAQRAYAPGSTVSVTVRGLNIPDTAAVTATLCKKDGASWAEPRQVSQAILKEAGAAAAESWTFRAATEEEAAGVNASYMVLVTVTDGGVTVREVKYYFLTVQSGS